MKMDRHESVKSRLFIYNDKKLSQHLQSVTRYKFTSELGLENNKKTQSSTSAKNYIFKVKLVHNFFKKNTKSLSQVRH